VRSGVRLGERLAGQKILLTGATGFLGKAVLAAILRSAGEVREILVLLRAGSEAGARQRLLDEVLSSDPFAGLPAGYVRERLDADRVRAVPGDLESGDFGDAPPSSWADVDTVIHCAATVSFEEALDDALALNTLGPIRLLEKLREAGSEPHFVHVSTAYVADRGSGTVSEDGIPHHGVSELDPDALLAEARALRESMERDSNLDPQRRRFEAAARRDATRREGVDASERAEALRRRWVRDRLSRRGRRRAIELGWPDTYALSKALGERLVTEPGARP
jgi:hypothetical protein